MRVLIFFSSLSNIKVAVRAVWKSDVTFGSAQVDLMFLQLEQLSTECGGIYNSATG